MRQAKTNTLTVELTFSPEQVTQLDEVARTRQIVVMEAIQLAVTEWLEKQYRLTQARAAMRKLGQGLGAGQPPHDTAQNHDTRLYPHVQP
jgi:hypothetical protein